MTATLRREGGMIGKVCILSIFTLVIIGAPLIGVSLSGRPAALFATFPPLTTPAAHPPFSWLVFAAYLLPLAGVAGLIAAAAAGRGRSLPAAAIPPHTSTFPPWGWFALATLAVSWFLAWTRLPWVGQLQRYFFIPLWFAYIGVANALCAHRSGTCPMRQEPLFFAALFPLSAVFWWFFEYLNQFVQNWCYTGVEYGPVAYSVHASVSFSTVLPAVYTTWWWLSGLGWLERRFSGLPSLRRFAAPTWRWPLFLLSCAGLIGVGLRPAELSPLLWIAPLLILTSLRHIAGRRTLFTAMVEGDWRPVLTAAMAALVCGFLWEMWNYCSLAKWKYSIPYVHRFQLFEMPVLGYMGYLPFGLLCIEITAVVREIFPGDGQGTGSR